MKTTNFEISKKLAEIGFEAEFNFHYKATDHINLYDSGYEDYKERNTPAYDLETLINALPKKIQFKQKEYCFWMQWSGCSDCLLLGYVYNNLRAIELEVFYDPIYLPENKSLADTAGRLLILLWKKKLIKFKE